ncbi:hypothetical protein lbkm_3238 [Lachnospiraceae bacterium KM106-2]|nr:hypothetical protein lbkm_3238 [Lachnospiraceae bacterium KM106-2]
MKTFFIVLGIILVVAIILLTILYFVGTKLQKKNEASQAQMQAAAQTTSLLVIDKKRMKLKDANLPKIVMEQTPKYLRRSKVAIVKAKIGPQIMNLICDEKIFDHIPVKKEVKAVLSGIYIMDVKGVRANLETTPKKVGFFKRMRNKVSK